MSLVFFPENGIIPSAKLDRSVEPTGLSMSTRAFPNRARGREVGRIVRQERLKDEKRTRLIEAAIEEFNEHGLRNASYNRIIERSGLSKGAVYYYFENKDSLLCTVIEEIGDRFMEAVQDLELPGTKEAYWDAVWDYRQREAAFFMANPLFGRIMIMLLERDPTFEDPFWKAFERPMRFLGGFVEKGQELGAVRRDLGVTAIQRLMWAVGRALSLELFDGKCFTGMLSDAEMERRSRQFMESMQDLGRRMLTP